MQSEHLVFQVQNAYPYLIAFTIVYLIAVLHQVPSNSRDSLVVEENIDNSWFSLRLGGGGESTIEAVPTRSLSTSSHERPASSTQPASRDLYPL